MALEESVMAELRSIAESGEKGGWLVRIGIDPSGEHYNVFAHHYHLDMRHRAVTEEELTPKYMQEFVAFLLSQK